ncbi:MAG: sigma-70 family RNA polymerase sigma factor [Phycisphaerae bacterium]|nr:sigma-70 family RNA polymerase sigma factor [Phycisphaerae bacterium]
MDCQQNPTHEALMARFRDRLDKGAFEQLVCHYASPAGAVAGQILDDRTLAEDAVQEAFVRVISKRKQYIAPSPFSRWFYAILRNVCIDMLRKRKRDERLAKEVAEEPGAGLRGAARRAALEEIPLLELLPKRESSVLRLRVVHSMPFKDIAAALEISEEAAKKRGQRGLRKLREKLSRSDLAERRAV